MKKVLLVIGLLLITSICFADVTAEIIKYDLDENGNIRIYTQYKVNNVEVASNYPKIDGKYYWITRYDILSFADMDEAKILERIKKDLNAFADTLIKNKYILDENSKVDLKNIIGTMITKVSTEIFVDIDSDGIPDKKWVVKTDGTKTEELIVP